jgi:hypothetical protein
MSIFDETDKEESKDWTPKVNMFKRKHDEDWITDNLSKILDDEKDNQQKKTDNHASQGESKLLHQFEFADNEADNKATSLLGKAFDSIGVSQQENSSKIQFPEPEYEPANISQFKPD